MKKHLNDIKEILQDTNYRLGQKLNEVGEQYGADSEEFEDFDYILDVLKRQNLFSYQIASQKLSKFIEK